MIRIFNSFTPTDRLTETAKQEKSLPEVPIRGACHACRSVWASSRWICPQRVKISDLILSIIAYRVCSLCKKSFYEIIDLDRAHLRWVWWLQVGCKPVSRQTG